MPTYEYRCPKGHTWEKFFPRISEQRKMRCPTCGKMGERLISGGAGIVFKGSGFYATDYKRAGEKKPAEGETKPASESAPATPKQKKSSGDK
jgi:putative FmdB family regulatory protein